MVQKIKKRKEMDWEEEQSMKRQRKERNCRKARNYGEFRTSDRRRSGKESLWALESYN